MRGGAFSTNFFFGAFGQFLMMCPISPHLKQVLLSTDLGELDRLADVEPVEPEVLALSSHPFVCWV
ncbi:hypothetical protein HanIR_Chr06g0277771 [Helianthus annuus]|nr:hypothetical protein HanIR_Chr06g0277771 [Helianthus annuus]